MFLREYRECAKMSMNRNMTAVPFLFLVLLVSFSAQQDWFALRGSQTDSREVAIQSDIFGDNQAAEQLELLAAKGDNDARRRLVYLLTRQGSYRAALRHISALPQDNGNRALLAAIASAPDQVTAERKAVSLRFQMRRGNPFLPVSINRRTALYMIDTNASFSMICESEARRLGMLVRDVPEHSAGLIAITGAEIPVKVATAAELNIGGFVIHNVAFLVLRDNQEPFLNLASNERGILGISVVTALETMRWSDSGKWEAAFASAPRDLSRANLCFDGSALVAEAQIRKRKIRMVVDTGSEATTLWPPFAREFAAALQLAGTKTQTELNGIGDTAAVDSITLPELPIQIGGFDTLLRPAVILQSKTTPESERHHGRLGFDLLQQARRATVDLKAMRLTLE